MPIEEGVVIAYRAGVVEMTSTIHQPERDQAEAFASDVSQRILEHQCQAMTDPAILNPDNLSLASCLVSRDPLPAALKDALLSLGFTPIDTESSGLEERSMFARFQKRPRTKLEKWRAMFLRAADVSPKLADFEQLLIEDVPRGSLAKTARAASRALVDAARTSFRLLLAPTHEGVGELERTLLTERGQKRGRLVLHSSVVRAMAGFVSEALMGAAPDSHWSDDPDDEGPLWVHAPGGGIVRSDPDYRAASFVARGNKELLTSYMESVLRQSLTAARQS